MYLHLFGPFISDFSHDKFRDDVGLRLSRTSREVENTTFGEELSATSPRRMQEENRLGYPRRK